MGCYYYCRGGCSDYGCWSSSRGVVVLRKAFTTETVGFVPSSGFCLVECRVLIRCVVFQPYNSLYKLWFVFEYDDSYFRTTPYVSLGALGLRIRVLAYESYYLVANLLPQLAWKGEMVRG